MKVITVKQPWASLIANGYKTYEFRTWNTKYRGDILIHAGKGIDKKAMLRFKDYNLEYPSGCIIAQGKITDSILVDDNLRKNLLKEEPLVYRNLSEDQEAKCYAFKLEDIKKIEPIKINGKLSVWNYEK